MSLVEERALPLQSPLAPHSLAVVIPSKNREQDVLRCLASIQRQPTQPDQIIVVDQSAEPYRLSGFANVLHLHRPELSGLTAAKNAALQFVNGEYVLFLDDDIEMTSDCVSAIKHEFALRPAASAVGCAIVERESLSILGVLRRTVFEHGFFNRWPIRRRDGMELRTISGGATAIRARVLAIEQFDETLHGVGYGEDFEYSMRAKRHGRFWLCQSARVHHRPSPANRYASQSRRAIWDNTLYFYDKFEAGSHKWNRLWLLLWMIEQSVLWIRQGMGVPPILRDFRPRLVSKSFDGRSSNGERLGTSAQDKT